MIIEPFNSVFLILMLIMLALIVGVWAIFRNKTVEAKKRFMVIISVIDAVIFLFYKIALSQDAEFVVISGIDSFNWFNELPLQLCNINMFLIPIGILTGSRALMGFSFVAAPLGAFLALIFPDPSFVGYSILLPRMLGYYTTHILVFCCGIWLCALGFYRPRKSDMPRVFVTVMLLSLAMHGVNILLRATVCEHANYFYTFGEDISILNFFWNIIPVPYLYLLPASLILVAYMFLLLVLFKILEKAGLIKKNEDKKVKAVSSSRR